MQRAPILGSDEYLKFFEADGILLARLRVTGQWGFAISGRKKGAFHFLAEGRAYLRIQGRPTLELHPGELVLLPRGDAHEIAHSPTGATEPLEVFVHNRERIAASAVTGVTLICGQFDMSGQLGFPAFRAMPSLISLTTASGAGGAAMCDILSLLQAEIEFPNFGTAIIVRNLLSSLSVHFIREWATLSPRAIQDRLPLIQSSKISRVLALIHAFPSHNWTLEKQATAAGLSRAAFSRKFYLAMGEAPHSYLMRLRMGIAAQLLEETDLRLGDIASRVGYGSEFSFSRAFKRARGISPSRYRNEMASVPIPPTT